MKDLSANSIDLLFCDLPYGQTQCKWDTTINLELFWKQVNRICKINCPMFFTTTTRFGVDLINSNPKNFRYDLVWVKTQSCGFLNAKKMPMRKHEMIYVFYRKLPLYDLSSHSHKFTNSYSLNNKNGCYDGNLPSVFGKEYDPPLPNSIIKEEKYKVSANEVVYRPDLPLKQYQGKDKQGPVFDPPLPNSILEVKSQKGKHSTQKPTELMKWILKYYSKEGDNVLDPTMGSGSTGIACKEMKRNFIGIEKDEKIYKDAVERLK
jgi:site-specific DNA-methyltransferase (adenine-specific)